MPNTVTYRIDNRMYINLTNRCTNNCDFCIRNSFDGLSGYYLWLDKEPTADEVKEELSNKLDGIDEIVFCGFGEPLMRWEAVIQVARYAKSKGIRTRVNTNGQADLFAKDDIVPLLAPVIDKISISLNEVTAGGYNRICKPLYGEEAYHSMLNFARRCKDNKIEVILSVVDVIGEDKIKAAEEIAKDLGIKLRIRKYHNG